MNQVRYFLAVAELLNFTRAAEACNVSQPSLTRAVKLLEREFGGELFLRARSNTRLTELGRIVLPYLASVSEQALDARRRAQEFTKPKKQALRLGVMCTIAPAQLVELLGAVHVRHPDVEIELVDATAAAMNERLLDGDIEVAVFCLPGEAPDARVHALPLYRERMMIVVRPDDPLAAGETVRLRDLEGLRYLCRTNCEFNDYADRIFDEQGVDCITVHKSERDDWILAMVASGLGFGLMPEHSIAHPGVVARQLVEPDFWRNVNLATVAGRPHSAAVGALVREAMRIKWHGAKALARPTAYRPSATSKPRAPARALGRR